MGFALSIFPVMAVAGIFIARRKFPDAPRPYKVHFYPVVPALYIVLTVCMMGASLIAWTNTSLWAIRHYCVRYSDFLSLEISGQGKGLISGRPD